MAPAVLVDELDRILAAVVGAAQAVIDRPHPTAGSLHRLHRELRRLRTALGVWEALLARPDRARLAPLDQRLKRLARLVGRIRDRDVSIDLLAQVDGARWPPDEAVRLAGYRTRLRDDARTGRELLRAFLRAEQEAGLFSAVRAEWRRPGVRYRSRDVRSVLSEAKGQGEARVRKAHRSARRKPSVGRLHRLRIRVRGLRHITDLLDAVDPEDARPLSAPVRRLQRDLGRLHDLDITLDGLAAPLRETAWAEALRGERSRLRGTLLLELEQKPSPLFATRRPRTRRAAP